MVSEILYNFGKREAVGGFGRHVALAELPLTESGNVFTAFRSHAQILLAG
jgi:hypothetical protein